MREEEGEGEEEEMDENHYTERERRGGLVIDAGKMKDWDSIRVWRSRNSV